MSPKQQNGFSKNLQFRKFQAYGFLKNLRFFEPFLMLFFLEKGISFLQIGTLYAIREITINLFEIPSGLVADAWGRRRTLAGSFVFYMISFTTFYFTGSYSWFIVAMLFFSLGEAFRSGVHKAMIFEYLGMKGWEDQKVSYYGHTRSASQTGSAVSSLIAAAIVFWTGKYSTIFILSTIPYLADLFLILSYPKELDGQTIQFSRNKLMKRFARTFHDFRISLTRWHALRKILTLSSFTGYYKASRDYLQPLIRSAVLMLPILASLKDKQRTAVFVGVIYFFIYLMNAFSSRNSGRFFDWIRNYERALLFTLLAGFGMGILAGVFFTFDLKMYAVLPFLFIFIFENARKPIGVSYISENMEQNLMASSLSAESQISSLIASGIAILLGFVADRFSVGISLMSVTALLLIAVPFIFRNAGRDNDK